MFKETCALRRRQPRFNLAGQREQALHSAHDFLLLGWHCTVVWHVLSLSLDVAAAQPVELTIGYQ
jgi:hypothetical protein